MSRMVEVVIDSVRVSLTNQQRIVVLREMNTERYLPIYIGPYEAEAITIALQEVEVARPQTHDLLKNILTTLSARLVRVEVVSLRDDVFYGNLVVETGVGRTIDVDSRPSDALALAVRAHVPILVSRDVLDSAGLEPEQDMQNQESASSSVFNDAASTLDAASQPEDESEHRLSIFEDFLQNLDIGKSSDSDQEDSSDEEKPDQPT